MPTINYPLWSAEFKTRSRLWCRIKPVLNKDRQIHTSWLTYMVIIATFSLYISPFIPVFPVSKKTQLGFRKCFIAFKQVTMSDNKSEQKSYHKKASGAAIATVKKHSKENELKLFGSCFWWVLLYRALNLVYRLWRQQFRKASLTSKLLQSLRTACLDRFGGQRTELSVHWGWSIQEAPGPARSQSKRSSTWHTTWRLGMRRKYCVDGICRCHLWRNNRLASKPLIARGSCNWQSASSSR